MPAIDYLNSDAAFPAPTQTNKTNCVDLEPKAKYTELAAVAGWQSY
jgi:hypothetical protein